MAGTYRRYLVPMRRFFPRFEAYLPVPYPRTAWLSLGSNMGDRAYYLQRAVEYLHDLSDTKITQISRVYQTEPVGMSGRSFFNLVVEISTALAPITLLDQCQLIELRLGRVRTGHWTSRTMDIDILHIEGTEVQLTRLLLPHPYASSRLFVLRPWLDVANPRIKGTATVQYYHDQILEHQPTQAEGFICLGSLDDLEDPVRSPWDPLFGVAVSEPTPQSSNLGNV